MRYRNSKYYQLLSNTFLFALGSFGSRFLAFFLVPLYTHTLTTTEYGISELVITGTNLIIPFVSLSIQDATLRFGLDKKYDKKEVLLNTLVVLGYGSFVTILLYPLISLYKPIEGWVSFFILIAITYMVRSSFAIFLKAAGKSKLYAIDSIVHTALLMGNNILFLTIFKLGLQGYFLSISISYLESIVFILICGKIPNYLHGSKINIPLLKEMIRFSFPMILNGVSWWIMNSSDKVMIEYYLSVSDSGIYSVAAKMPAMISMITTIFNQAWMISSISEYDNQKDPYFFKNVFNAYNCYLVLFSACIIAIIKPFMHIYVAPAYYECWKYVPILLLGSIFQAYSHFFGAIYTSAKKNLSIMVTTTVAALINILLNAILIPRIGIQGAVIATAVSYLLVFIFRMVGSQKYIQFNIDYLKVGLSIFILLSQAAIVILDYNQYVFSIVAIAILVILNHKSILDIVIKIKGKYTNKAK